MNSLKEKVSTLSAMYDVINLYLRMAKIFDKIK